MFDIPYLHMLGQQKFSIPDNDMSLFTIRILGPNSLLGRPTVAMIIWKMKVDAAIEVSVKHVGLGLTIVTCILLAERKSIWGTKGLGNIGT